jgi:hypothetical protein
VLRLNARFDQSATAGDARDRMVAACQDECPRHGQRYVDLAVFAALAER